MFIGCVNGKKSYIVENSDARGWKPLLEKKINAYKAIFEYWMEAREK